MAETLPEEVLGKMHAPPKPDVPIITSNMLTDFDGFVFGTPTRQSTLLDGAGSDRENLSTKVALKSMYFSGSCTGKQVDTDKCS